MWVVFVLSIVLMAVSIWALHRLTNKQVENKSQNGIGYWLMYICSLLTTQGKLISTNSYVHLFAFPIYYLIIGSARILRNKNSKFRFASICTIFCLWILCNYYKGTYTSLLAAPIYKPVVNSIEDLAESSTIQPLSLTASSTENYIMVKKFTS